MKTVFRILIILSLLYGGTRWYEKVTEKEVHEVLPTNVGEALRKGTFIGKDGSHASRGSVTEYIFGEEKLLHFEGFYVTNGLDLRVMLSEDSIISSSTVMLARLQGNSGDQNYAIPKEVNTNVLDTVIIYSKIFRTIFSIATLR